MEERVRSTIDEYALDATPPPAGFLSLQQIESTFSHLANLDPISSVAAHRFAQNIAVSAMLPHQLASELASMQTAEMDLHLLEFFFKHYLTSIAPLDLAIFCPSELDSTTDDVLLDQWACANKSVDDSDESDLRRAVPRRILSLFREHASNFCYLNLTLGPEAVTEPNHQIEIFEVTSLRDRHESSQISVCDDGSWL